MLAVWVGTCMNDASLAEATFPLGAVYAFV